MSEVGLAGEHARPSTVLYIEDNEASIRLLQRIFRMRPDVDLLIAMTGAQGLELAGRTVPTLILLDQQLPDLRGDAVITELRDCPSTSAIPVVIFSGESDDDAVSRASQVGATGFLPKPFDLDDLLQLIDKFCPPVRS